MGSEREETDVVSGISYAPPEGADVIRTIDVHAAGEPLRVVVDGLPQQGHEILERGLPAVRLRLTVVVRSG